MPLSPLLDRRLVIVTGKGGTGKTTVSAALGLAAAAAGKRALVAEVGPEEHVAPLFEPDSALAGYQGRELRKGLSALRIDPYEALAEYLGLQIGLRGVVRRVLANRAFRQLMDASPGWRELITLGKIWHLGSLRDAGGGAPRFDLIVVDAPATGHGLTFLDVARVVGSAVRAGPLRRHAGLVDALIRDREQTLLLPVALAEELPARETAELVARLRAQVGIWVDRLVVNAVTPPPYPPGSRDLGSLLRRLPPDLEIPGAPSPAILAACVERLSARAELNRRWIRALSDSTGLPALTLPRLPLGVRGPADLEQLAGPLLGEGT